MAKAKKDLSTVKAVYNNLRSGTRKINEILQSIRGKKVDVVLRDLQFNNKRVSKEIIKTILPGRYKGKDVTVVDVFEAVGQHSAGNISEKELTELELVSCPSAGACGGQFTANTMACVSEAIGLALP